MTNLTKDKLNLDAVILAIKQVLPSSRSQFPLHEPWFRGNELNYLKECLDSNWVSTAGPFIEKFEKSLADYTGIPYAVAVVNGTAALHIALQLSEVGPGDEVVVPTLTFIATANAVSYTGATPHFADMEWQTLGLNPAKLEQYLSEITIKRGAFYFNKSTGLKIKALICMHAFGHPSDLDLLIEVCKKFNLILIEDAAEAMGSLYKNRHVGCHGKMATLSFNGNKTLTTGGGGALLTSDKTLANRARHFTTTAKVTHAWEISHDEVGYNYRMPNLNAALGLAQVESLDFMLSKKRELASRYHSVFQSFKGLKIFKEPSFAKSNYWLNNLILDEENEDLRDSLLALCHKHGILARPAWNLMHELPMYRDCPKMDLSLSESAFRRMISLPSSSFLGAQS